MFHFQCLEANTHILLFFICVLFYHKQEFLFERKVKATDRTKTPEEIAKEEATKLHALESKRLARMEGDFLSEDEFSDISTDEEGGSGSSKKRRMRNRRGRGKDEVKKKKKRDYTNPEEMSDSDVDDDDDRKKNGNEKYEVQFTADGLMYVDKQGNVVGKVGDEEKDNESDKEEPDEGSDGSSSGEEEGSDDEASPANDSDDDDGSSRDNDTSVIDFKVGMSIQGNYHASEQYGSKVTWYNGTITAVRKEKGTNVYDVTYEDGDFEEGMIAKNIRQMPKSEEEKEAERAKKAEVDMAKKKKLKAKMRAK